MPATDRKRTPEQKKKLFRFVSYLTKISGHPSVSHAVTINNYDILQTNRQSGHDSYLHDLLLFLPTLCELFQIKINQTFLISPMCSNFF